MTADSTDCYSLEGAAVHCKGVNLDPSSDTEPLQGPAGCRLRVWDVPWLLREAPRAHNLARLCTMP
ncbi:hypothetical protein RvY_02914 [Ramazzottius varieornatus]|uniref:Uncharacterized protein n=1 Tax=Ramazzottius varieornatus TaxID=947166 RepID=A0A1D1UWG4_RAMVA|nr:hypothetical protein RvY_02914 [Ramazzottius varieornatus]